MTPRVTKTLGWAGVILVSGIGASTPALAEQLDIVLPGGSIQRAVDAAEPGDTIFILPGVYRESVLVTKSHVTLAGAGPDTVITGGVKRAGNSCAEAGNGICVLGTAGHVVRDVHIHSLTVSGFKKNGIWASRTDRLGIHGVTARNNGKWGIAQDRSTRSAIVDNTARDNADAGILVANMIDKEGGASDTQGTVIGHNDLIGNRIGVTVRRVRHLWIEHNYIAKNCGGVFVVGDENKPKTGALTVSHNRVYRNNKRCAGSARREGHPVIGVQGAGIVLTGAEDVLVTKNKVRGNVGTEPLSGGIVLYRSFSGTVDNRNVISRNIALNNSPADVANRDKGTGNKFIRNLCQLSEPADLC